MALANGNPHIGQRALLCFSFVTLCFLQSWFTLAFPEQLYYRKYSPLEAVIVPVLCCEAILFALLLGAWWASDRFIKPRHRTWLRIAALLVSLIPAGFTAKVLAIQAVEHLGFPRRHGGLFAGLFACVGFLLIVRYPRRIVPLVRRGFLLAVPVELFICISALWTSVVSLPQLAYADQLAPPPPVGTPPGSRVIWFIFDEMSQRIAFEARPSDVALPNFDRLRAASLHADEAYSPADSTKISIPSLVLGRTVQCSVESGPRELRLGFEGQGSKGCRHGQPWSAQSNVFDDVRKLGGKTAAVGWFHPYGRILRHSLDACYWVPSWLQRGVEEPYGNQSLWARMVFRLEEQFTQLPLARHLPVLGDNHARNVKVHEYEFLRTQAMSLAADRSFTLVFLHMPLPHMPGIYSRREGRLCDCGTYLDNLVLADRFVGDVRRAMEQSGVWDSSWIIVSADHSWRLYLWRGGPSWTGEEERASGGIESKLVPFLVKAPNQHEPLSFSQKYETVNTRRLIDATVTKQITTPADAERLMLLH
ncbi:MAG: hypothetical protein ACRD9L_12655 [Bryobacteraceae bacterium]